MAGLLFSTDRGKRNGWGAGKREKNRRKRREGKPIRM